MTSSLIPSELGTKQYWEECYQRDLLNYAQIGDIGEVWFGLDSASKMIDWVEENIADKNASIMDLGCGNGHLLLHLFDLGFLNIVGVDYSPASVALARKIALDQSKDIHFEQLDIIDAMQVNIHAAKYSVCLDKGTFDAISLATSQDCNLATGTSPEDMYIASVASMLSTNGILLITSCNWTEAELLSKFKTHFRFQCRVKYPSFTFGGISGQKVTTIGLYKS